MIADVYWIVNAEMSPTPATGVGISLELDLPTVLSQVQPQVQPQLQLSPSPTGLSQGATPATHKTITNQEIEQFNLSSATVLPLTFNLSSGLNFAGTHLWHQCQEIERWRQQVSQLGARVMDRSSKLHPRDIYWLPIVLTAKGPLYGEVIGQDLSQTYLDPAEVDYFQPIHLTDRWRQPLYGFAYKLLQVMAALPSVYLLQFGWQNQQLYFDRLWPFPNRAALASFGVQTPDLFTCYWRCVAGLPITDLQILGDFKYRSIE